MIYTEDLPRAIPKNEWDLFVDLCIKPDKREKLIDVADSPSHASRIQFCPVCRNTVDECDNFEICKDDLVDTSFTSSQENDHSGNKVKINEILAINAPLNHREKSSNKKAKKR